MNKPLFTVVLVVVSLAGCAAEPARDQQQQPQAKKQDSTSASKADSEDTDATEPLPDVKPCVTKASVANDKGIGAYCDETTKCTAKGQICTGDFGANPDASFCTKLCAEDAECGKGARCFHHEKGSACVLDACVAE